MSPSPARTSGEAIVAAARRILEEDGLEALSMAAVASRVGVRPPSLYKHVRDRAELVTFVLADAAAELTDVLEHAPAATADATARVRAMAAAYRVFARQSPRASALMFADLGPELPIPAASLARAARPIVDAAAALAGPDRALPAARALTAFAHGFTTMESAGAFRLGGDVDEAFEVGLDALVRGLALLRTDDAPVPGSGHAAARSRST